jgi:peptidoglycan/LPS O-acetylase OafA/YrhL
VFFSHHFDLSGFAEPQVPGLGQDFGELGVEIFFCLSGFLICLSLQRSQDWIRFAAARVLRIFPNLTVVLIATSAATLLWYRNDAHLAAHIGYVARNLAMFVLGVTQTIPGVFADATRHTVNDPLWTLPYELWLYVMLALMFFLGGLRAGLVVAGAALVIGILWSLGDIIPGFDIGPLESGEILRLGSYFLSGALLAAAWPLLRNRALALGVGGLAGIVFVRLFVAADTLLLSLSLAAAVIGLGRSRAMAWFSAGGDASYGIYVFAWPVQQFSILLVGSFWPSMLTAFAITVAIGYATWHGFEKRAVVLPNRIARSVRRSV